MIRCHLVFLQELCQKLHEQIGISEEERYGIEFKLNMVLNEVRCSSQQNPFLLFFPFSLSLSPENEILECALSKGPRPQH